MAFLSRQMIQAIRVHQYGGPEQLKLEQVPRPVPRAGEVLIRVHAAGVLPADWKVRQGLFKNFVPVSFPYIPGSAISGVVKEVGPGVTSWKIGQEVFGRSTNGGYTEYTTIAVEPPALVPETPLSSAKKGNTDVHLLSGRVHSWSSISYMVAGLFEDST